jgi:methionyl-tRNA formyltransferase
VLRRIADSDHRPSLVVAPPDRPRGRGRTLASPPAAELARELSIDVLQTPDVNGETELERIRAAGGGLGLVCAFGQIIREPLLSEVELLNVHPSLLPRWRGAAPIERAIMARDSETGVSIARVTAGLDSGPVAMQERLPITAEDDYGILAGKLATLAGELALKALDARAAGALEFHEQDEGEATYAEKIDPAERALDPDRTAEELAATVRALTPHVGAHLELGNGEWLGVLRVVPAVGARGIEVGTLESDGDALVLECAEGALRIERVKPAGKRAMSAEEYLRGHPVPALR